MAGHGESQPHPGAALPGPEIGETVTESVKDPETKEPSAETKEPAEKTNDSTKIEASTGS